MEPDDLSAPTSRAAFGPKPAVLNIAIDKAKIVTNTRYTTSARLSFFGERLCGKSFDFKGGGFRQIV